MPSYQIALSPTERAAGRFVLAVRRALQKAFVEENKKRGLTQSDIAREIGVHRSVINRELRGEKDITIGRVAQLAHVLGRRPALSLPEQSLLFGSNHTPMMTNSTTPFVPMAAPSTEIIAPPGKVTPSQMTVNGPVPKAA
jgi:hypothetical protein